MTDIPDEIIERCARAMYSIWHEQHLFENIPAGSVARQCWIDAARAALTAVRYGEMREALKRIELTSGGVLALGVRNDVIDDIRAINDYATHALSPDKETT